MIPLRQNFADMIRERSSFLRYIDENGHYADFHALRTTFITNLSQAGVSPKTAQTLARHSEINLTMNTYTMLSVHDQASAVEMLPPIPMGDQPESRQIRATGTDGPETSPRTVPTMVSSRAKNGAIRLASNKVRTASDCTEERQTRRKSVAAKNAINTE